MTIATVSRVTAISNTAASQVDADVRRPSSLLPTPMSRPEMDSLSELYALLSQMRKVGAEQGKGDVAGGLERKKMLRAWALHELKEAEDAHKKGGVFGSFGDKFGKVAKVAAVAGAIALAVGSGGLGTPVAVLAVRAPVPSSAPFS